MNMTISDGDMILWFRCSLKKKSMASMAALHAMDFMWHLEASSWREGADGQKHSDGHFASGILSFVIPLVHN